MIQSSNLFLFIYFIMNATGHFSGTKQMGNTLHVSIHCRFEISALVSTSYLQTEKLSCLLSELLVQRVDNF